MSRALVALVLVLALALALAGSGCAKDAASLSPFPCAADQSCAGSLACLPGTGCVAPIADALCPAGGDCGAALACDQGRCQAKCADGAGCGAGRSCSAAHGAGVCLTDCASGQTCGAGLVCQDAWGKKACLPDGAGQGASCSGEAQRCGALGSSSLCIGGRCEQACTDGAGCGAGRVCSTAKGSGICLAGCGPGQTCAAGLVCGTLFDGVSKACIPAAQALDAACTAEGSACGPVGAGGLCTGGRCEPACHAGAGCSAGRLCTSAAGDGVCLADCTAGQACPGGLACNGPWPGGKKYCIDPVAALGGTCSGATCGPKGLGGVCDSGLCTVACAGGTSGACPTGQLCSATAAGAAGSCLIDCSAGQACAAGLACSSLWTTAQRACLPPALGLGKKCAGQDGAACGPIGAGGTCQQGHCEVSCSGTSGPACPAGRSCSISSGPGACLIDCTASASACPADLACNGPYPSGKSYCTAPGEGIFSACATQDADCGPKALGGKCDVGECAPLCANHQGCAAGTLCTEAGSGPGSCMVDCSGGQACPSGLACGALPNGQKACVPPGVGVDQPCGLSDGSSCGPRGSGGLCYEGLCEPPCGASGACAVGRVCSGKSSGGCLADCSATGSCPTGQLCEGVWHDGKSACMAAGHSVTACAGATATALCNQQTPLALCPTNDLPVGVQCTGYTCPLHATCLGGNQCGCATGYTAVNCQLQACSGSNCPGGYWWCRPDAAPNTATCSDPIAQVQTQCTCVDGRTPTRSCGDIGSCEYRCSLGCDVTAQDCPGAVTPKCSLVADTAKGTVYPACVAPVRPAGGGQPGAVNQPCTRSSTADDAIGHDTCAAGLLCTSVGNPQGVLTCHKLCKSGLDCNTTSYSECMARTEGVQSAGTCEINCSFFSTSGSVCGAGLTCSSLQLLSDSATWNSFCRPVGNTPIGSACTADTDCGLNSMCRANHASATTVCTPLCDYGHQCPSGYSCTLLYGMPNGGGYCN